MKKIFILILCLSLVLLTNSCTNSNKNTINDESKKQNDKVVKASTWIIKKTPAEIDKENSQKRIDIVNKDIEIAKWYISEWKYKEAEELYLNGLKLEPNHQWLKEGLGYLYITMWKKDLAKEYISGKELVSSVDEGNKIKRIEDNMLKAQTYKEQWKYKEAEDILLQSLKLDSNHRWLRENLGYLYVSMWEMEKSKQYLDNNDIKDANWNQSLLDKINKDLEIYNWEIPESRYKEAEEVLLNYYKLNPENNRLKEWLWSLYVRMGNLDEAKKYMSNEEIDEYVNHINNVKKIQKDIEKSEIYITEWKYKEAEQLLLADLKLDSTNELIKQTLKELYIKSWQKEKADSIK